MAHFFWYPMQLQFLFFLGIFLRAAYVGFHIYSTLNFLNYDLLIYIYMYIYIYIYIYIYYRYDSQIIHTKQ